MTKKHSIAVVSLLIVAAAVSFLFMHHQEPPKAAIAQQYADPASCAQCHATEAAGYARTGMAHAFYKPKASDTVESPARDRQFYHAASGSYYTLTQHDGKYYQRRWQKGFDGNPENVEELLIDYIMGSGNHVKTYLHREQDGTLIELPLAWYAEGGGHWGMNPGFDNAHPMTRRPIAYECMFCHNAYPQIPPIAHRDLSANSVYSGALPEGIDCQRCHGPGAAHVKAAQTPGTSVQQIRAQILNPTHLSNDRQMEVCEQCHLETTSQPLPDRIRHYDQEPFGYRADQPLASFNAYFARDPDHGRTDNFEIVDAPYRLRQSQCYLKSQGALTCETCHNPHDLHKGLESVTYYANICMKCHGANLPGKIAQHQHPASNDCVSCHMPKRRTEDVIHAVMTDHLIQRFAPPAKVLLADRQEVPETPATAYHGPVKRYLLDHEDASPDDDLYNAAAQIIDGSNLEAGIPALADLIRTKSPSQPNFSIELGDAMRHTGNLPGAIDAYRQALKLDPLSSRAQRRLGVALGNAGQTDEALTVLQGAIDHEPDNALLWYEKALIESRRGDSDKAVADLRKTLELKPDFADAQNTLGSVLAQSGDIQHAETAFRAALTTNPYDSATRANLGRLLAGTGDWKQAAFHLQKAVQLDPANVNAHGDYAVALLQLKRLPEAKTEAEAALKINPEFGPAQLNLAEIFLQQGQVRMALPLLEKAAHSPAPGVAEQAQTILQQLGTR
ncbi:tetratricopeptide repeat protein [Granulicella mallensis]|uniref:Tetratricopeptide (TPR) repeat protein/mono/diheme cytochrome c family protein n=1 Tax=Granulicella mallensis TaxID=940614 RepID=A0A7W7ZM18_9BACT|nr:tetratricopeptide repeat protein [Granulicella mallensis]MBB5062439.1 tetratricopeptide (TPR) repeat protein/mono/diheme cytochrome c family protein [Granulicella mallensis]